MRDKLKLWMRAWFKKRLSQVVIVIASISCSPAVYAVAAGFYMGLAAGPATNSGGTQQLQVENSATTTPGNPRSNQFGTRIFMGYDFAQYIGVEGGLDYFSNVRYKTAAGTTTCSSATARVRDFDFLIKGMLPIKVIDVFGKAGVAITYLTTSGDLNPDLNKHCGPSTNQILYRPMISVGMSYDLSQNWVADVSWARIMVGNVVSSVDFYGVGISYHFVDRYCGQFLCD
ncbi:MAG: hypothetical protein A3F42_07305 [Gammaproteobacteria bacterium RIFCSPHIGHO2_12_FULL_37_34]|nr:MAG: hypothetical protein A3F42_07305 [Gammaproteobacteria bacterium RIFCSPHIGHO2_12_FULL_37_34]